MTLVNLTTLVPVTGEDWSFDVRLYKDKAHLRLGDVTLVADPRDTLAALADVVIALGRLIDQETQITEEEDEEAIECAKLHDPYPYFSKPFPATGVPTGPRPNGEVIVEGVPFPAHVTLVRR